MRARWKAFGVSLALTLVVGFAWSQQSTIGGSPSRPRFQQVTGSLSSSGTEFTFKAESALPGSLLRETDAAANNQIWRCYVASERYICDVVTDALSGSEWLGVDRTAGVVDSINLQATAVQVNGAPILKYAAARFNGGAGSCSTNGTAYNITGCTRSSAGIYQVNYTAAGFSVAPVCVASATAEQLFVSASLVPTTTNVQVTTYQDGIGFADHHFAVYCLGS